MKNLKTWVENLIKIQLEAREDEDTKLIFPDKISFNSFFMPAETLWMFFSGLAISRRNFFQRFNDCENFG